MATISKLALSGSTGGKAVKIAATSSPGTTIHTASNQVSAVDEIWLYAMNTDTSPSKLTVQWGDTNSPDDLIELTIPSESGLVLVAPGLILEGATTPWVVRAFAASANVLTLHGYVIRSV